jgi:mevalonate kinase
MLNRRYFGKILLFGEYSVIEGSAAALIPYTKVSAHLIFPEGNPERQAKRSNSVLCSFAEYLKCSGSKKFEWIDQSALSDDLAKDLYLESTIPENKGLGSSGAICAAIYESYQKGPIPSIEVIHSNLAAMEAYFHGISSGVDPLSIYLGMPVVVENKAYRILKEDKLYRRNSLKPFLFDTGFSAETAPLVRDFKIKMTNPVFSEKFRSEYVLLVNRCIEDWTAGALSYDSASQLSVEQLVYFNSMIPENILQLWKNGLHESLYALKLCGSGGGGMVLGFTPDMNNTREFIQKHYGIEISEVSLQAI